MNWDYAAGFMDADGSIGFFHEYGTPRPCISASQTTEEVLIQLKSLFSDIGGIYHRDIGALYVFRATGTKMLPILKELVPRLIVKQPQCLRLIEFIECRTNGRHNKPIDEHCKDLVTANTFVGKHAFLK